MKNLILCAVLIIAPLAITGCKTATTSTPPAPGYSNSTDQTLGETLAALNGFATQEKTNYATDSASIQAVEKTPLNAFITALNLANAAYVAYHAGTGTLAQAQAAVTTAQTDQATLISAKGVQ